MINILLEQSSVAHELVTTDKAEVLEGYVTEMLRIDPPVQGVYREAKANETIGSTSINAGDLIYLDVASANLNVSFQASCCSTVFLSPFRSTRSRNPRRSITLGPRIVSSAVAF